VEGEGAENRSSQGEAPRPIKQRSPPTRKVSITGGDERRAVSDRQLGGRKGEAQISLGKEEIVHQKTAAKSWAVEYLISFLMISLI